MGRLLCTQTSEVDGLLPVLDGNWIFVCAHLWLLFPERYEYCPNQIQTTSGDYEYCLAELSGSVGVQLLF